MRTLKNDLLITKDMIKKMDDNSDKVAEVLSNIEAASTDELIMMYMSDARDIIRLHKAMKKYMK